jgi:membrane-bound metal-dependent hydrolase YbcI (DUF457 family)
LPSPSLPSRVQRAFVLGGLLVLIFITNRLLQHVTRGTGAAAGIVDETGHIATGLIALAALRAVLPELGRQPWVAAALLLGSFAIDIDHVPASFLHTNVLTAGTPRPYTHALITPLVLGAAALAATAMRRRTVAAVAIGLTLGVLDHLTRDLAVPAGTGVVLLWPLSEHVYTYREVVYLAIVTALALIAVLDPRGIAAQRRAQPHGHAGA